jgi:hypothetical protein
MSDKEKEFKYGQMVLYMRAGGSKTKLKVMAV